MAVHRGMQFENRVPYNMLLEVTTEDLRRNLANVISRAAYGADPVVVTRRGRRIAAVVSIIDLALLQRIKEQREARRMEEAQRDPARAAARSPRWAEDLAPFIG